MDDDEIKKKLQQHKRKTTPPLKIINWHISPKCVIL